MITYLAGLQGIPRELYEAGRIDGCSSWRLTRHITLPLLTPTVFFNVVMGFIGGFQIFEASWILTGGGPGDASRTIAVYLYELAFRYLDMGYGAAVALAERATLLASLSEITSGSVGNGNGHSKKEVSRDQQFARFQMDAPLCDNCGSITVRNGNCYLCHNCGASMGCS